MSFASTWLICLLCCLTWTVTALDRSLDRAVAGLTDSRRSIHQAASRALIAFGEPAVAQLAVLAGDANEALRGRVALVLGEIAGDQAMALLLPMADDHSPAVREAVALALGRSGASRAYEVLRRLLRDPQPEIREAAAVALGVLGDGRAIADLANWPNAGGEINNLILDKGTLGDRQFRAIQIAMKRSLDGLLESGAVPAVIRALRTVQGPALEALCEASWRLGDPRLCPVLVEILEQGHREARVSAAVGLGANGDSRAIAALIQVAAAGDDVLGRSAARSLQILTGHQAAAGQAWTLWWASHGAAVQALISRDTFIARLHDPAELPTRSGLAAFSPADLEPLVNGALGRGAVQWPALALRALRLDDPARWTPVLFARYDRSAREQERVGLVLLLGDLGDPVARQGLCDRYEDLRLLQGGGANLGSLQLAFEQVLGLDPIPLRPQLRR